MNSFDRRPNTIQNAGKAIVIYSSESDCNNSTEKESRSTQYSKSLLKLTSGSVSTQCTGKGHQLTPFTDGTDVEMELDTNVSLDSPMEQEPESLHMKVVKELGSSILENLKKNQVKMTGDFDRHEIKNSHRKQMVVWMDEVLHIFKSPIETFFMAVHIMDRYLDAAKTSLKLTELHEIGIVSMFIASKYLEVDPLTLQLMIEKVGHGKIREKAIKKRERKILCTLKFKLAPPNVFNFLESYGEILSPNLESDLKVRLNQNCIKLAKKSLLDRKKAFLMTPSDLADRIITKVLESDSQLSDKKNLAKEFL